MSQVVVLVDRVNVFEPLNHRHQRLTRIKIGRRHDDVWNAAGIPGPGVLARSARKAQAKGGAWKPDLRRNREIDADLAGAQRPVL